MSSTVQIICPNLRCRKVLSVSEEHRGKQVKCQYCQNLLRVPFLPKKEKEEAKQSATR